MANTKISQMKLAPESCREGDLGMTITSDRDGYRAGDVLHLRPLDGEPAPGVKAIALGDGTLAAIVGVFRKE